MGSAAAAAATDAPSAAPQLPRRVPIDPRAHMLAGMGAGFVSTIFLYPLDLAKARFQGNDGSASYPHRYKSSMEGFRAVWKQGGVRALYQGLTPTCIGVSASWGIYFGTYSLVKSWLRRDNPDRVHTDSEIMLASSMCGAVTAITTNPIWVVKTNIQMREFGKRFPSMAACGRAIVEQYGYRGFYRGMAPSLIGVSHGAFQFVAYERLRHMFQRRGGREAHPDAVLSDLETLTATMISKTFAVISTYPHQVVRLRMQRLSASWGQTTNYNTITSTVQTIFRNEGVKGFFKGAVIATSRVMPSTCVTFIVYERAKAKLAPLFRRPDAHQPQQAVGSDLK